MDLKLSASVGGPLRRYTTTPQKADRYSMSDYPTSYGVSKSLIANSADANALTESDGVNW